MQLPPTNKFAGLQPHVFMKYALKNVIVLDGTENMEPQDHVTVLINRDKIEAIVPSSYDTKDYEVIDMQGQYIMPGMINLHAHLIGTGKPFKKELDLKKQAKRLNFSLTRKSAIRRILEMLKTELMSGVTTIRTVGGFENTDTKIRDLLDHGDILGPRMIVSNKAISVTGGHLSGTLAYEAQSDEDVTHLVDQLKEQGVDFIKLMITDGVMDATGEEPGSLKMPESYVRAAVIRAHELKLKVAAHVEGQIGLSVALETGVDYIEHGSLISSSMIKDYKHNGTCNIATFSPYVAFSHVDPDLLDMTSEQIRASEVVLKGIVEATRGCIAHSIPVGLGSDPGYPFVTHYDMWRELYYFTQFCDVDNNFALHTATQVNAKILGIEYTRGTIEPGKFADLIVTRRNPLDDLSALKEISYIFTRGQMIKSPSVERNEEIERSLDTVMQDIAQYQM